MLVACTGGANPETLVEELRILAIVAEPPEAAPGEQVTITTHIADPGGVGFDVGVWTCSGYGTECFEADADRMMKQVDGETQMDWTLDVPLESAALLVDEEAPISVWALACEPGLCPMLDDQTVSEDDLFNPTVQLEDLPMQGVSLGRRSLWVSQRASDERRQNPRIQAGFDETIPVVSGETAQLCFATDGIAEEAYGYATAGGFTETVVDVIDGVLELDYAASKESGAADVWVLVQSEDQGSVVWSGTLEVE